MLKEDIKPPPAINYRFNYRLLVLDRLIALLGSSAFGFALSLYVLDITSSAAMFSLILSLTILPGALINFFAGVFADNHDKKKILFYSNLAAGISVFLCLFLFIVFPKNIIVVGAYSIVLSVISAFHLTTLGAAIPNIVEEKDVNKANSSLQSVYAIVRIIGPALGAAAYKSIGMEALFTANGTAFLISAFLVSLMVFSADSGPQDKVGYRQGLQELFDYLDTNRVMAFFLIYTVIFNLIYTPLLLVVIPFINYKLIRVTAYQLSVIEGSMAFGTVLGAVIISYLGSDKKLLRNFFTILAVEALLVYIWLFPALGLVQSRWMLTVIFGILLAAGSILNMMQLIPMLSYFQLKVPVQLRGRLSAVLNTAFMVAIPLGMLIYGKVLELIPWTVLVSASATLLLLLCMYWGSHKYFRQFLSSLDKD
jgi:DHA3 family macrolide efflux protein-like MFS transporter